MKLKVLKSMKTLDTQTCQLVTRMWKAISCTHFLMPYSFCHPQYHLLNAYKVLSKVYTIAVAMPVSSSSAECSFSALKRVKSRIRSSLVQDRLETLLLMTFLRKICWSFDYDELIDTFGKWSQELSKELI